MARLSRLPDLLTTANLCCGVGSILLASQGQLTLACWLVFVGAAFDVLDGLAARALGGGSQLGAQLDSLADLVTFGVAPGFLVFSKLGFMLALNELHPSVQDPLTPGPSLDQFTQQWGIGVTNGLSLAMVLVIASSSAWRLARFNLDTRQTSGFLGLPTPANGLFWTALTLVASGHLNSAPPSATGAALVLEFFSRPHLLLLVSIGLGALMLSELPLPSLKFKHFKWRGNQVIYLLGGIGAVLVVLYGILAVPPIMVLYILSPLWGRMFPKGV